MEFFKIIFFILIIICLSWVQLFYTCLIFSVLYYHFINKQFLIDNPNSINIFMLNVITFIEITYLCTIFMYDKIKEYYLINIIIQKLNDINNIYLEKKRMLLNYILGQSVQYLSQTMIQNNMLSDRQDILETDVEIDDFLERLNRKNE